MKHKAKESTSFWHRLTAPALLLVLLTVLCSLVACEAVTYEVAYYADGEPVKTVDVLAGQKTILPAMLGTDQYEEVKDADGNPFDFDKPITEPLKLYTESKTFTVTFVSADGTEKTEQVKWGATVAEPITVGYAWQLNGEGYHFNTPIKSDITLTQSAVDYTVTFILEDGATKTVSVKHGEKVAAEALPVGYDAWAVDGAAYDFDAPVLGNLTLTAPLKQLKVVLEAEDGESKTVAVKYGHSLAMAEVPAHHTAWTLDGEKYDFGKAVTAELKLVAPLELLEVTFATEDGGSETATVKYGHTVSAAAIAAHHTDWTLNGAKYDFATPVTKEITLVSPLELLTVTLKAEDGATATMAVKYGHAAAVAEVPAHHVAWTLDGVKYDFSTPVKADLTLVSELETLTLTYYDKGTLVHTQTVKYGKLAEAYTLPEYATAWHYAGTNKPYAFAEAVTESAQISADYETYTAWLVPKDGERDYRLVRRGETVPTVAVPAHHTAWLLDGETYDFATPVTGEMTLTSPLEKVKVILVTEEGDSVTVSVDYGYGLGETAIPAHHTAWTLDGEVYDLNTPVTAEIKLVSPLELLNVTFVTVDGESKTVKVKYGHTVSAEELAEHHEGWTLNGNAYAFETPVTEALTLTSDWTWYTVTYVFGGKEKTELTAKYHWGQKVTKPEEIAYQEAWKLNGEVYDFAGSTVTGDLTLTSQYREVTVSFWTPNHYGQKAEKLKDLTVRMYDKINASDIPTLAAYYNAFATGRKSGAFDFNAPIVVDGDTLTLYAYVKQVTATIIWKAGLGNPVENETLTFYLDQTLDDMILSRQFSKMSYTEYGAELTGKETPTSDFTLYVTPARFKITYHVTENDKIVSDYTEYYDATSVYDIKLANVIRKDAILNGYKLSEDGEVFKDSTYFWTWAFSDSAREDEHAFTNLTVWVDFKTAEREVTSAQSGLTVTDAGVLSVSNATTFKAWLNGQNGAFVIPRKIDGKSVKSIKLGAFANIAEIKSLYIFDFDANEKLLLDTASTFPGGTGNRTFVGCTGLTDLWVWSDTVTSLGIGSFNKSNTKLTKAAVILGAEQVAGTHWFYDNTTLESAYVELAGGATFSNPLNYLFSGASNLQKATLKYSGATLGNYLFNNCKKLTSVTLVAPDMKALPQNMFNSCELLETLDMTMPNLTEIGSSAFSGCKSFVPTAGFEKVTTIGGSAFYGCSKMTTLDFLTLKNVKFTTSSSNAFASTGLTGVMWDVAAGSVLPSSMFQNCKNLQWFIIPDSVKANTVELYSSVFSGCESLTTVAIDFTLYKNFGNYGSNFFQRTGLHTYNLVLHDDVTAIPGSLFYGCNRLVTVSVYGKKLANISGSTFQDCYELQSVTVKNAGDVANFSISPAFANDSKLKSIDLPRPTSGKYTGYPSFTGLHALEFISNMECYTDLIISLDYGNNKWYDGGQSGSSAPFSPQAPLFALNPETGIATWNDEILLMVSHNIREKDENGVYTLKQAGMTSITVPATIRYIYSGAFGVNGYEFTASVKNIDFTQATKLMGIGQDVFANSVLETVELPDSIEKMGKQAFWNAKELRSVKLPTNAKLTMLPEGTFKSTGKNLKTVNIPETMTTLGNSAFESSWVEKLTYGTEESVIGSNIKSIGYSLFSNTYGAVDVSEILAGWTNVKTLPQNLFSGAFGIRGEIRIPSWYTTFGQGTFALAGRYPNENENIPKELWGHDITERVKVVFESASSGTRTLSGNAFTDSSLGTNIINCVELPSDAASIGNLFGSANGLTEPVEIPAGVKTLNGTFSGCRNLTKVIFADGGKLTTIGNKTFSGCKSLTAIVKIPDTVKTVGSYAFGGSNGSDILSAVMEVNWTLDSVGSSAFKDMYYLSGTITLTAKAMQTGIGQYAFAYSSSMSANSEYDKFSELTVNFLTEAQNQNNAVINNNAFANRKINFAVNGVKTNKLTFTSLKTLGVSAFANSPYLEAVSLTFNTTSTSVSMGNMAFQNCPMLTSVVLKIKSTKSAAYIQLGLKAFASDKNLAYFEAPIGTKYNSKDVFEGAFISPKDITVKLTETKGLTYVKNTATTATYTPWYYASKALANKNVTVDMTESKATAIGAYAFKGCGDLTLKLPTTLTEISDHAFDGAGITSFTIPETVKTLGEYAFNNTKLTSIVIPNSVTSIGAYAFYNCGSLVSATLSSGLTAIPNSCFNGCAKLKSIVIPEGVKSIGQMAFMKCSELESVTLPISLLEMQEKNSKGEDVPALGNLAFNDCTSLKTVYFNGTTEQWNAVKKSNTWNLKVPSDCKIICSDSE